MAEQKRRADSNLSSGFSLWRRYGEDARLRRVGTTVRECSVRLRDGDGIEHEVVVLASSVLEAAALGLAQFRRTEWSHDISRRNARILVEVRESIFYEVPISNAESWLKRNEVKDKLPEDRWRPRG